MAWIFKIFAQTGKISSLELVIRSARTVPQSPTLLKVRGFWERLRPRILRWAQYFTGIFTGQNQDNHIPFQAIVIDSLWIILRYLLDPNNASIPGWVRILGGIILIIGVFAIMINQVVENEEPPD
ncbi:hypothetical protein TcWFU_004489 [Taenia crassiceps]|uniref:Uncharacterized protein n=1 Tax=Taenia crassiceps TaxID=6207 RepID=A0ABR4Q8N0_9CEST